VQEELIVRDGPAQVRHERKPARAMLILARRVERVAAAGTLGAIHGNVRPPQECRDILAVLRIDRDTDTRLDHETMSLQDKGLFQGHE
jgi:hypothetical protein